MLDYLIIWSSFKMHAKMLCMQLSLVRYCFSNKWVHFSSIWLYPNKHLAENEKKILCWEVEEHFLNSSSSQISWKPDSICLRLHLADEPLFGNFRGRLMSKVYWRRGQYPPIVTLNLLISISLLRDGLGSLAQSISTHRNSKILTSDTNKIGGLTVNSYFSR